MPLEMDLDILIRDRLEVVMSDNDKEATEELQKGPYEGLGTQVGRTDSV
jgi:hypothetical protein